MKDDFIPKICVFKVSLTRDSFECPKRGWKLQSYYNMFWKRFTLRLEARCKWLYHHTNQDILEDTLLVRESCSGCPHILPTRTLCSPHPRHFHPNGQSRRWIEKLVKVFIICVTFLICLLIVADCDQAQANLQEPRSSGRLHTSFARELFFTAGLSLPQRERHFACVHKYTLRSLRF